MLPPLLDKLIIYLRMLDLTCITVTYQFLNFVPKYSN